jgi:O-acetyl-ADP-ribose deacetylase
VLPIQEFRGVFRRLETMCWGATMNLHLVTGDLLDQQVDVIVNAWNRNIIPWWLLIPQGVSGAIKRRGGYGPFIEVAKHGPIPLGGAVVTGAGRLAFKAIIHVAGISMWWRSSEVAIRDSVRNALAIARDRGFASIAFPLIGAGTGAMSADRVLKIMQESVNNSDYTGKVIIVKFGEEP